MHKYYTGCAINTVNWLWLNFCQLTIVTFYKNENASGWAIIEQTRLKILPVLTRKHYTSLLHWV
jgi:hypothetical protein